MLLLRLGHASVEARLQAGHLQGTEAIKMDNPYQIIKTIALTEKSNSLLEYNQYTFVVDPAANKMDIKRAVEYLFERKVKAVNVMNRRGKTKRNRYGVGKRADWKRAIVTLQDGQEPITVFT